MKKKWILFVCFFIFLIQLSGQKKAQFTDSYIQLMQDSVTYEIPEVQELVHIIFAITPLGLQSEEIIDRDTEYYKEVLHHFLPFNEEKIVKKINKHLKRNRYARLKMDAVGFYFKDESIIKSPYYTNLNWDSKNWLEPYIKELEQFAKKTDFRDFYQTHLDFYASEINLLKEQLKIKDQWSWLEKKFDNRYHSYRITFSPLVGGSHSTNYFYNNHFKQAVMFICSGYSPQKYGDRFTPKQLEGLMGRIVFTEIDHNYINPVSDQFEEAIKAAFHNMEEWNNFKYADYNSNVATFNEYMTWAFYSMYVIDNYNSEDAALINDRTEALMERRGFIKFKDFNGLVQKIYLQDKTVKAAELYQKLFDNLNDI